MTKAIDDFSDNVLGIDGGILGMNAAEQARNDQAAGLQEAQRIQNQARDSAIAELRPQQEFGNEQLNALRSMLADPVLNGTNPLFTQQGQADFLKNNAFYQAGMENLNRATMNNAAARGKLGSGDTLNALYQNAVATGAPLYQQELANQMNVRQNQLGNLFNAQAIGQNASNNIASLWANATGNTAAQQGFNNGLYQTTNSNMSRELANPILGSMGGSFLGGLSGGFGGPSSMAGLGQSMSGAGNALAGSIMSGAGAAGSGMMSGLASLGAMFSDVRLKTDIKRIGQTDGGLPIYSFRYKGSMTPMIGVMAQDVEQVYPDAVVTVNGFKAVKYGEIA